MQDLIPAHIITTQGRQPLAIQLAQTTWQRFKGLMLSAPLPTLPLPQGLLITRCTSVHGFLMRYPLDLVYLSADHTVTHTAHLKPWRISFSQSYTSTQPPMTRYKTAHTLELPTGTLEALGIAPGDKLELSP